MRRGETAKYVQQLGGMADLYEAFHLFASSLATQCALSLAHSHKPSLLLSWMALPNVAGVCKVKFVLKDSPARSRQEEDPADGSTDCMCGGL